MHWTEMIGINHTHTKPIHRTKLSTFQGDTTLKKQLDASHSRLDRARKLCQTGSKPPQTSMCLLLMVVQLSAKRGVGFRVYIFGGKGDHRTWFFGLSGASLRVVCVITCTLFCPMLHVRAKRQAHSTLPNRWKMLITMVTHDVCSMSPQIRRG